MLKLEHLYKTFNPGTINEKIALADLSLHLKPGDFVTVIGGNGAGKSTMLNAIAGVWAVGAIRARRPRSDTAERTTELAVG